MDCSITSWDGGNTYMEDKYATYVFNIGGHSCSMVLLADGHGGEDAAEFLKTYLPACFEESVHEQESHEVWENQHTWVTMVSNSLNTTVQNLQQQWNSNVEDGTKSSGSTLSVLVLHLQHGWNVVGHLGDSRIHASDNQDLDVGMLLIHPDYSTLDHTADLIEHNEIVITPSTGPLIKSYVRAVNTGESLSMSRAFGNTNKGFYPYISRELECQSFPNAKTFILASDGLWDVLDFARLTENKQYMDCLARRTKKKNNLECVMEWVKYMSCNAKPWDNTLIISVTAKK
jgi:serine/threonine protein phosphatase PrpC